MSERSGKRSSAELFAFDYLIEQEIHQKIIGIDEAGRGPLAGPVVASAVRLDLNAAIDGINDSKKLTAAARERLYDEITQKAIAWSVASSSPEEIDKYNILNATFMAMKRALDLLKINWEYVIIDGNQALPDIEKNRQRTIVEGDGKSASIAAASIIAKVTRDRMMLEYDKQYPVYEFHLNKGYATEHHRNCIAEHGLCEIHRRTFCETFLIYQTSLPL